MRRTRPDAVLLAAAPLVVAGVIAAQLVTHRADLFQEVFSLVREPASIRCRRTRCMRRPRGLVHSLGDPYAELYSRDELALFATASRSAARMAAWVSRSKTTAGARRSCACSRTRLPRREDFGPATRSSRSTARACADGRWTRSHRPSSGCPGTPVDAAVTRLGEAQPIRARYVRESVHAPISALLGHAGRPDWVRAIAGLQRVRGAGSQRRAVAPPDRWRRHRIFRFRHRHGPIAGASARRQNRVVATTWSNLAEDLAGGDFDIAMVGVSVTLDRQRKGFLRPHHARRQDPDCALPGPGKVSRRSPRSSPGV